MFPLNAPLLPATEVVLHVFEERYRALVRRLAQDPRFGVVLIERGSEVGGGDARFSVGTLAEAVRLVPEPDGRWLVVAAGRQRLRVVRWLPDDPHPWAEVELLEERPLSPAEQDRIVDLWGQLQLVLDLELAVTGTSAAPPEEPPEPEVAVWHLAALAPLGELDLQRLLETEDPAARLELLGALLDDAAELLWAVAQERG